MFTHPDTSSPQTSAAIQNLYGPVCTLSVPVQRREIFWPDQITNTELWKRTKQPRINLQIKKRKWGWLGHTLRKPPDDIARQALELNPQGKRGRGRPRNTWRRTVLEEAQRS